ncbi:hypothetical protein LUZ61_013503 [Rhynchospora tenuis]|uniref:CID domain-containing protein n=1 Tax=Rhynchospora tenuis TaxID=198213 RepID=A0AAD5Z2R3_9POAL|nr:hypothetical protein LUZ61_013503 [Rhynchospora tenuis]
MKGETGNNGAFSEHVLAEKLSKLNNSQQSIETLSHWCIFHRKKARNVVEIWEKQFNSSSKDQKVSLLYLANDILQNSKRKGGEFVNEFWKVLPACLRDVYEHGEESSKKVVTRLVDIWDERKVFGSRSRALKDDIFGDGAPAPAPAPAPPPASTPALNISVKSSNSNLSSQSNPIKIARKDATTLRVKLAVGGMPEKIVTSYQSLFDENLSEEAALNNCSTSVGLLEKIEKDLNEASISGNQQQISSLMSDFQEKEASVKKFIEQLEGIEALRTSLINQLKEAIKEQESKSELVSAQIHVARSKIDETSQASQLKRKLPTSPSTNGHDTTPTGTPTPPGNADTADYKKAAAAVAAKLAASSSSAQLFSSVLSSFAAEHANTGPTNGPPGFSPEKRPRLEAPFSQAPVMPFQPPLPPVPPPGAAQMQQFGPPFAFPGGQIPPPPPLQQLHMPSSSLPLPPPGQQQQGNSAGFFSPPGVGFFNPLQPAPSAQRQQ